MAYKVTNLKLAIQSGTTSTLYATWDFTETSTTTANSSTIKKGTVVKIKSGAKYYNGASIPDWVIAKEWIVLQVDGDRVVIDKSKDGKNSICSAVNAKDLTVVSGGGSSSSSTTTTNHLDYYEVNWQYATGDGVWFSGTETNVKVKNDTWSYPANATKVKCTVMPVSKTDSNNKPYWSGTKESKEYEVIEKGKPEKPSPPDVTIEKYRLTAVLDGINDGKADQIEFYIIQDNSEDWFAGAPVNVVAQRASYSCDISAGHKYRACCRAINVISDNEKTYSEWSDYSAEASTIPSSVTNVSVSVESKTSVRVSWTGCENAKSYTVDYTTKKEYFDSSNGVSSITVENTYAIITGIDPGFEWFFRVRANNENGESGWSNIVSTIIGSKPDAPTTWSSTTTAEVGDTVILYWVHNTEDGSKQTAAQIELIVNGVKDTKEITTNLGEDDEEKTYSYNLNTSNYAEGAEIKWSVRTKGILDSDDAWSEWSIQRTITLHAPPTLSINAASTLSAFPYDIKLTAGPSTQKVLSYHVSITASSSYETVDFTGTDVIVSAGEEVYSTIQNVSTNPLTISLSAGDVTFENNQNYTITATVAMNSGLTTEVQTTFTVRWSDDQVYIPGAAISIDRKLLCAYISPFCVDKNNYVTSDAVLSVYRREFNGTLTPIATDLNNDGSITVTDPHPSLDYARYRIVAINKGTSVVGFEDIPGEPVHEHALIIQWNEKWSNFNYEENDRPVIPPWTGSLLRLPYNIDIEESYNQDVSLVGYIGRKHPVTYYGTQKGEGATWKTEIPKTDKETIYGLRRLAAWDGDVYVREPSGLGYWANITVSMSIKHCELTVPISFSVQRVEGGI